VTSTNTSAVSFAELGVPTAITNILDREGKRTAFPIQADTLSDTLSGRDVLGRGKTGSGKTLAFSIPVVARIGDSIFGGAAAKHKSRPGHPRALVLAPTRELATQIDAVIAPLAAAYQLKTVTIFGGVSQHWQEKAIRAGADIVVACPGRLEDLIRQRVVSLDAVKVTVLDEADHMADLGFLPAVTRILEATPSNGQRMLFSATLDKEVDKIVKRFLHDPVVHEVDSADSHVDAMTHHVFHVASADAKRELVKSLASGTGRRVLFTRTKHQAQRLAKQLTADGIPAVDLHGNLAQRARDRNLARFSGGQARVLVATDVAARGVHVDGVELVVHVDPPAEHKAYLHRSGRTARAGSAGDVVTVVLPEQRRTTATLLRAAKITVEPENVSATSPAVVALVGEKAPWVDPLAFAASERKEPGTNGPARRRQGAGTRGGNGRGSAGNAGRGRGSQNAPRNTAKAPADGHPHTERGAQKSATGKHGGHDARRPGNRNNRRPSRPARAQG
jgi:superfamily II DNA/RNA helicase